MKGVAAARHGSRTRSRTRRLKEGRRWHRVWESARRPYRHWIGVLKEDFVRGTGAREVDEAIGVIRDVKILGLLSVNGRRYALEAIRAAAPLYEGVMVNVDHPTDDPDETRSAYDRFGKLQNIRVKGDGLYGDLHYLKSHTMAKRVVEDAKRGLGVFGMSHNATGNGGVDQDGTHVVQEITNVRHVDLVADPATVNSLFESRQPMKTPKAPQAPKAPKTAAGSVADPRMVEATGMPGDDLRQQVGDKQPLVIEDDEPTDDGGDLHGHAADMIETLLKQFRDGEMDYDTLKAKVGKCLGIFQDDAEEDDGGDDAEEDDGGDDYSDSVSPAALKALAAHKDKAVRRLVERFDRARVKARLQERRAVAKRLCDKARIPAAARTAIFLESLAQAPTKKAMRRLVNDRKLLLEARRPRGLGQGNGLPEMDAAKFASLVRD